MDTIYNGQKSGLKLILQFIYTLFDLLFAVEAQKNFYNFYFLIRIYESFILYTILNWFKNIYIIDTNLDNLRKRIFLSNFSMFGIL